MNAESRFQLSVDFIAAEGFQGDMKKVNNFKMLKFIFIAGCILLGIISMTGCAITPVEYALTSKLYYERGQHDEAIRNAREGIALNPGYAPNWYWLGVAYYNKGQNDEAINPFKKVIELTTAGPQLQSSYHYLGLIYHNKGNYNEAIARLGKALELNPADTETLKYIGRSYYFNRNYDEAIKRFNKSLELNPADVADLGFRGWTYYHKSNFNEAIKDFNKAIENIKPQQKTELQDALRGKGFSYLGLGDGETAVNMVKQAKSASDYDNNYDLSLIHYVLGKKEKAWELRGGKGALGISVRDYNKDERKGAGVDNTVPGGPAEKAGLLARDVIIKLNNAPILNMVDFIRSARTLEPGTTAKITILREGIERDIDVKVAFADFLMETDQLIAPVMAKRKIDPRTAELRDPVFMSSSASDVDQIPVVSPKTNKNAYAIVIGIEKYRQNLPKADFAGNDARMVTGYLTRVMGYPEENIVTLTNENAAKSDFEKYFEKWLWNNVEKNSMVFIYFSGHGAPNPGSGDAYLVPYDGDPSFIEQTGYSLKRLYEALGKLPAKEIIVALDSCFSGAGGRSVIAKGARPLVMNLQSNAVLSKNMTVLSASSGEQISSTYDEKGHGLFTYFMLKGIRNENVVRPDGSIAISDLFGYIKPQVERIARKQYNNEQTPQLIGAK
jgi:tetratricopeptide (TPR) repeat protein